MFKFSRRNAIVFGTLFSTGILSFQSIAQEPPLVVKMVAEKKVPKLPEGDLYWLIENFPNSAQAKAAEGPTSLWAEIDGKTWLFSLGHKDLPILGTKVIEIGPIPSVTATEFLLRINNSRGAPGAKSIVHTHPGSEAFFVLSGQVSQKTQHGVAKADAGNVIPGHGANMAMEVSSTGTSDLNALVMFIVDANKPFSSPAKFE